MSNKETKPRMMVGKIVSDKMQKTIVVLIQTTGTDPKYGKIIRKNTKIHAHDEEERGKIGDMVRVCETRPYSKTKCWNLVEIIS